ncbi:MAG: hypothetical protein L3J16_03280 [Anaerolineales bacterium]|nr:hypothetical protein [Anaerolineales bacterium]
MNNTPIWTGDKELRKGILKKGFNDILETFLYFLFVRTLRLCDQRSFEESDK